MFHEQVTRAMEEQKTQLTLITGDFNAKLEKQLNIEESKIGKYSCGNRNNWGNALMNYL